MTRMARYVGLVLAVAALVLLVALIWVAWGPVR